MEILRYPAGVYQANCYIIYDDNVNEGFIIDPGGNADEILNIIAKRNIKVKFIILTHGHFDHTGGVNLIRKKLGIPVFVNENDIYLISTDDTNGMIPKSESIKTDEFVKDEDIKEFGNEQLKIIHTPGHTPGGITVKVKNSLFTGDTLFAHSVGRTDLPGGSHETLIKSIKEKLLILPDDTKVYPGHGPSTTIGNEKTHNPFL